MTTTKTGEHILTSIQELDKLSGGLRAGHLTVLAGRPKMGVSTLAMNMVYNICASDGRSVGIITLDRSAEKLKELIAQFEPDADKELGDAPLFIVDKPYRSILDIMDHAADLKNQNDIDLLVIDKLQLIDDPAPKEMPNSTPNLEDIVRTLKIMAKSLNIPVLVTSSLTKDLENRPMKIPVLEDLNAFGRIEHYIDNAWFLYRWGYYGLTEDEFGKDTKNQALLIVGKNWNETQGRVQFSFKPETALAGI